MTAAVNSSTSSKTQGPDHSSRNNAQNSSTAGGGGAPGPSAAMPSSLPSSGRRGSQIWDISGFCPSILGLCAQNAASIHGDEKRSELHYAARHLDPSIAVATSTLSEEMVHLDDVPGARMRPKVTYTDGRTYEGEWVGGKRHGRGREESGAGDFVYEGQFRDDKYEGFGVMRWGNGAKYVGSFEKNRKQGWGHEYYASGDHFQGMFYRGQIHGRGTYCFKDGTHIEGEWRDGRLASEG